MIRKFNVTVNGVTYNVEVEEIKDGITASDNPKSSINKSESGYLINAPIPGMVSDIKVKEGNKIKKGQVLMIIEAMKMENEIMASVDGVVKSIKVSKGASVNLGETLVVLE